MKQTVRAWVVTQTAPAEICLKYSSILPEDLIIAVDGGFKRCLKLNLEPRVIIGDFDSLPAELIEKIPADCQKISHPSDKNETDTQLAVDYCIREGIRHVTICNSLEGRFDHSLALVQNLMQAHLAGVKAELVSASQIVFILDYASVFSFPENTLISLISLSEISEFNSSRGLKFPLDNLTLYNWQSRGISNVATHSVQKVNLASGLVLAVVTPII
jgi:thiamine pyrophosphokinase